MPRSIPVNWRKQALALSALALLGSANAQQAQPEFTYRELEGCSAAESPKNPWDRADSLQTEARGASQVVLVKAALNCGARVKVGVESGPPGRAYITIDKVVSKGALIAVCDCVRRFEITLTRPMQRGVMIYLLKDGLGTASVSAE